MSTGDRVTPKYNIEIEGGNFKFYYVQHGWTFTRLVIENGEGYKKDYESTKYLYHVEDALSDEEIFRFAKKGYTFT